MKPPGKATPGRFWSLVPWLVGGQILNEYVPLCPRKLGVFREGETVRETGEDVELFWKGQTELTWLETNDWAGFKMDCECCGKVKDPFLQESGCS